MKTVKFIFNSFIFLFYVNIAFSQDKIAPENLKKDIDFLVNKYEAIHPNLYAYTSKDKFLKQIYNLKNGITDSLTSLELWLKLAPIVNNLKHGHTSISPNQESINIYREQFNSSDKRYLPFSVFIKDSVIYLRELYNQTGIEPGVRIKKINGHPDSEILSTLLEYKSGEKKEYRLHCVEKTFLWDFTLIFPSTDYLIEYLENGSVKSTKLSGITEQETEKYSQKVFPFLPDYLFKKINDNTGLIEYNACNNLNEFKIFLDSTFLVIKENGMKNIIIDIRENGGGNSDLNDLLLTYLVQKPFKSYNRIQVKVSKDVMKLNEFYSKFDKETIIELDTYHNNYPANNLLYTGNVYLLTSIDTFSSGTNMAMLIKDYEVGTIIGQETGGIPTGYGDTFRFKLPYSKINATVSYKVFTRPSGIDDMRGVVPDIIITPTISDLLSENDLEMDYVINFIKDDDY